MEDRVPVKDIQIYRIFHFKIILFTTVLSAKMCLLALNELGPL